MGGDFGPRITILGGLEALRQLPALSLTFYGDRSAINDAIAHAPRWAAKLRSRYEVQHTENVAPALKTPSQLLRNRDLDALNASSIHASLRAVRDGVAHACVSSGHTGEIMALARHALGMVGGMLRPAISSAVLTEKGQPCYILDLGANIDCPPRRLIEFARLGAEMVRTVDGVDNPRVALLNVGTERSRGTRCVRETDELLRALPSKRFQYLGFVEGDDIFTGDVNVIVCDGFVGNVALKTSEGLASMLGRRLQHTFEASWWRRLVSGLARPALSRFKEEIDPVRYNGASFLGLTSTVVKSHGGADARGFSYAVLRAASEVELQLPKRLAEGLNT